MRCTVTGTGILMIFIRTKTKKVSENRLNAGKSSM